MPDNIRERSERFRANFFFASGKGHFGASVEVEVEQSQAWGMGRDAPKEGLSSRAT